MEPAVMDGSGEAAEMKQVRLCKEWTVLLVCVGESERVLKPRAQVVVESVCVCVWECVCLCVFRQNHVFV